MGKNIHLRGESLDRIINVLCGRNFWQKLMCNKLRDESAGTKHASDRLMADLPATHHRTFVDSRRLRPNYCNWKGSTVFMAVCAGGGSHKFVNIQ